MSHKQWAVISALGLILLGGSVTSAPAEDIHSQLDGYHEVPAVSTLGRGTFFLRNTGPFTSELSYELEGEIIQAHIHLGQAGVNGGVTSALPLMAPPVSKFCPTHLSASRDDQVSCTG